MNRKKIYETGNFRKFSWQKSLQYFNSRGILEFHKSLCDPLILWLKSETQIGTKQLPSTKNLTPLAFKTCHVRSYFKISDSALIVILDPPSFTDFSHLLLLRKISRGCQKKFGEYMQAQGTYENAIIRRLKCLACIIQVSLICPLICFSPKNPPNKQILKHLKYPNHSLFKIILFMACPIPKH